MSFYLEPPTGNISLQSIEAFAFKRLNFLFKIYEFEGDINRLADSVDSDVLGSECLIEGTMKDEISHFILRLAMCLEADTSKFFTQAEVWLFNFRFLSMSEEELWHFFRRADRKLKRLHEKFVNNPHLSEIISVLKKIKSESESWRTVVKGYKQVDDRHGFAVPFYVVPGLVKTRLVFVHRGSAVVPYRHLDVVMSSLFKQILLWGINRAAEERETTQQDPRIRLLTKRLQMKFRQCCKPHTDYRTTSALSQDEVEEVSLWFPPCMSHLHRKLRQNHRLHHHSRIQYTLFLKEIGMPVHESVKFWKKEYSFPVDIKDGRCCHDWKSDGRRYTYNIRHLYGLEGACTNYRGHCCRSLQNSSPGHGDSGGCPFKHFDKRHLEDLLHIEGVNDKGDIIQFAREGKCTKACQKLFVQKMRNVCQSGKSTSIVDGRHSSVAQSCVKKRKNIDGVGYADTEKKFCQSVRSVGDGYRTLDRALTQPDVACNTNVNTSSLKYVGNPFGSSYTTKQMDSIQDSGACNPKKLSDLGNTDHINMTKQSRKCEAAFRIDTDNRAHQKSKCFPNRPDCDEGVNAKSLKTTEMAPVLCHRMLTEGNIGDGSGDESVIGDDDDDEEDSNDVSDCQSLQQEQEDEQGVQCFDHDICPSQMCRTKQQNASTTSVQILKPADFYFSFQKLVHGLTNLNTKV